MILSHSFPVGLNTVEVTINQDMKCLIPNKFIQSEYLLYALKALRSTFVALASSSTHGTKRLQSKHYLNIAIPIPPLEEQK